MTVPWKVFLFHPIRVVLCVFCLRPLPSAKPEAPFLGFSPVVLLDEISQWALATSWKNRPVRNEWFFFHLRFFTLRNPKRKGTIWSKVLHDFLASRCLYHLPPRFIWFLQKIGNKKTSLRFHQLIGVIFTRKLSKDSTTNIANATAASVMMLQSRGEPQKMVRESTFKGGQTL